MKKIILILFVSLSFMTHAQHTVTTNNDSERPPYRHYSDYQTGFWCAASLSGGLSSCDISDFWCASFDLVAGYRFSQYLKVGLGVSPRCLFAGDTNLHRINKPFPIFLEARGNIIDDIVRQWAPYWSFDLGFSINGGIFISPNLGFRVGLPRHCFTASVGYTLQQYKAKNIDDVFNYTTGNVITLKIGYEF